MNTQTLPEPNFVQSVGKILGFTMMGAIAAFGIFAVMSKLAEQQNAFVEVENTFYTPELNAAREDKPTNHIKKQLPEPPKPVERPPQPPQQVVNNDQIMDSIGIGQLEIDGPNIGIPGPSLIGPTAGDATPIVRVEPRYPIKAQRDGVEGWVSLSFSVDEIGRVTNVKVLEAQPKHYFEKEARKALRKWRYKPKMVDGKAIVQHNQSVMLEFNMAGS